MGKYKGSLTLEPALSRPFDATRHEEPRLVPWRPREKVLGFRREDITTWYVRSLSRQSNQNCLLQVQEIQILRADALGLLRADGTV